MLNGPILKILDSFNTFNHEINIKRKDTVSAISTLKEVSVGGSYGPAAKHDPEELKRLSKYEQFLKIPQNEWESFEIEG
jgi:hypothetical protein